MADEGSPSSIAARTHIFRPAASRQATGRRAGQGTWPGGSRRERHESMSWIHTPDPSVDGEEDRVANGVDERMGDARDEQVPALPPAEGEADSHRDVNQEQEPGRGERVARPRDRDVPKPPDGGQEHRRPHPVRFPRVVGMRVQGAAKRHLLDHEAGGKVEQKRTDPDLEGL